MDSTIDIKKPHWLECGLLFNAPYLFDKSIWMICFKVNPTHLTPQVNYTGF